MTQSFPTYNFQNITVDTVLKDAFELNGVVYDVVSGLQKESAKRSLNFIFSEWSNEGINLFAIGHCVQPLALGQNTYPVPPGMVDITELTCAQFNRQLGGIPFSSAGGNASAAFDGNPATACTQTSPNGYISYDYGLNNDQQIYYVGIQSNDNITYTLALEYTYDDPSGDATWYAAYNTVPTYYPLGQQVWFFLNISASARAWRIRETGGATLNVQEIYFDVPNTSYYLKRMSREIYTSIPNKSLQGGLGSWYLDRTKDPVLKLWPTPDLSYPFLVYNFMQDMPDVLKYTDTLYLPKRYMNATRLTLATDIASKFYKDQYELLNSRAQTSYLLAAAEDAERADMHIGIDITTYFDNN